MRQAKRRARSKIRFTNNNNAITAPSPYLSYTYLSLDGCAGWFSVLLLLASFIDYFHSNSTQHLSLIWPSRGRRSTHTTSETSSEIAVLRYSKGAYLMRLSRTLNQARERRKTASNFELPFPWSANDEWTYKMDIERKIGEKNKTIRIRNHRAFNDFIIHNCQCVNKVIYRGPFNELCNWPERARKRFINGIIRRKKSNTNEYFQEIRRSVYVLKRSEWFRGNSPGVLYVDSLANGSAIPFAKYADFVTTVRVSQVLFVFARHDLDNIHEIY